MRKRVVLIFGLIVGFAIAHFIARANPIEIHGAMVISTTTLCEYNGGLAKIKVDRYPPYSWVVYCEDGSDWHSKM